MTRFGTKYGGWVLPEDCDLNENSIVYSAGVGEDISFDISIQSKYGCNIYLIDPTKKAIKHFEECKEYFNNREVEFTGGIQSDYYECISSDNPNINKFTYIEKGLWNEESELKFYKQTNKNYVSQSLIDGMFSKDYEIVNTTTIDKLMKQFGHNRIDLLKLDIEGAEITVLEQMLDNEIYPKYLCIEFDLYLKNKDTNGSTLSLMNRLRTVGYDIFTNDNMNITFCKKRTPSSFCTMCTIKCGQELVGFLLSLSLFHTDANVYIVADKQTKEKIESMTPQPKLNIKWLVSLDKYSDLDRSQMVEMGLWDEFQMAKADVISFALQETPDTLFLDSDTIILDKLFVEGGEGCELGVSPQFIKQKNIDETGYYNGGMLWTNNDSLPGKWCEFTKTSRYHDQASIEDLVKVYPYFEFGENYNLQTWRFILGLESGDKIASYVNIKNGKLYYKDRPLKFIHTHFNSPRFQPINNFFIQNMMAARMYRELAIVYRVINDKWILQIPKQPFPSGGMWNHKNDSYRELAVLLKVKNKDVDIELSNKSGHCWLKPNILTYDRPTLQWCNNEILRSSLFLLGNGDMKVEGVELKKHGLNVKPWIFWGRRPMILERTLQKHGVLKWSERDIGTFFIGNFENSVQEKFRTSCGNWSDVIDFYHCTKGNKHKFSQEEYLMKLRSAKFGLCLRGYGSKCHREVELMAFGTVPIVTPEVSIDSYADKLIEGVHYIKARDVEELKSIVVAIDEKKWTKMSKACYDWYQRNIHSDNCWNTMITNLLYYK